MPPLLSFWVLAGLWPVAAITTLAAFHTDMMTGGVAWN